MSEIPRLFLPFPMAMLLGVAAGCGRPTVTVETQPPGAAVWTDGAPAGPAPQKVTLPKAGAVSLRISHPGFHEWQGELRADSPPEKHVLRVELKPRMVHTLVCETQPSGAKVLLDGQFRGLTPLTIEQIEDDSCTLVFRLAGYEPFTRSVDMQGAPGKEVKVAVALRGLTESYYLECIKKEPNGLGYYVDLAHGYALDKRLSDAVALFEKAVVRIYEYGASQDANRLWAEADRIITRQFAYGDDKDVAEARKLFRPVLKRLLKKYGARSPELYRTLIVLLATDGDRDGARRLLREATGRFPDDRNLRRLSRHLRL